MVSNGRNKLQQTCRLLFSPPLYAVCTHFALSASCLSLGHTQASLEVLCLGLPVLSPPPPPNFTWPPPEVAAGMGTESPTGLELALLVPPTPLPAAAAKLLAPGTVRDFRRSESEKEFG